MKKVSFSEICTALRDAPRILVVSHCRPDGDALGSTIAAALWLKNEGHEVTAWNEDGLPQKFSYLPESRLISKPSDQVQCFDAILILDTAVKNRMGSVLATKVQAPLWIAIDHHISNGEFADLNHIEPTAPATGQMLAEGFLTEGITITPAMAANLYVAISTDTGSFQYDSTSARTFEIIAALVRAGVSVGEISQKMYSNQPWRRLNFLRHALVHAKFSKDHRVASFSLTKADADALTIIAEDTEGIIDHLRSVDEVVVAIFFEELPEGKVRLSLRSKTHSFNVADFCAAYGGGGHALAAGASIQGELPVIEAEVLARITNKLTAIDATKVTKN